MVPLKYLSNFWRTLECAGTIAITDTKLYVLVVTLSKKENTELLQQLKLGFKRVINWNKY